MSETYDVRARSFIKMPEVKCCVACGQPLPSDVKPMNNHMSRYISESGKISVLNSDKDIFEIKQGEVIVKLHKLVKGADGKEHAPTLLPKPTEAPKQPTTPTK